MNSQKQTEEKRTEKITQLTVENQELKEEKKSDKTALVQLEKEISMEKKYQESQQRFETIFYKSKLGNKIIAPDLRIIQINQVFQSMLGYSEQEIVGTKIIAFAHPDFIHHWHKLQENLWSKKIPSFQIETCLVKKNGLVFWCQVTSIIFRDNEVDLGYTIVEDISKRKALELELQQLYEHQDTMMHMVAHDLKGPLNNIKSLSDFLKKNLEKLPQVEAKKKEQLLSFVSMIADTCEKSYAIIRDLLFIGELKSKVAFKKTDLQTFIDAQLPVLGIEAKKKGVNMEVNYPKKPIYAHINEDKFARLLENLLSNAVKFTNTGGLVTITLKKAGDKAMLQVTDTGIGIPEKLQASVFDKFTKAGRMGTEGETTTGLGLYIVKQIVEMHQGKIRIASQQNQGTSFFIELR